MRRQIKKCDRCGHKLILEAEIWEKMEWAGEPRKHFQIRHSGCGGSYGATVSELAQRVSEEA